MGAFFTNLQVHTGAAAPADVRAEVIEAVRRHMLVGEFVEVPAGEPAARSIVIGPAGAEPWISVYDEATEDQDGHQLAALAAALSSPARAVVTVLVHDSDVLELGLVRGAPLDRYNSRPDYFTGKAPRGKAREAVCGHAERWRELLVGDATPAALTQAWQGTPVFAEQLVDAVAPLLGWNPARARVGFRYLDEAPEDGRTRLGFRPTRTPAHEQRHQGPPRFTMGMFSPSLALAVGDPVALPLGVTSAGGPSRGLAVVAWGPALDQGLIELTDVQLVRRRLRAPVNLITGARNQKGLVSSDNFDRLHAPFKPSSGLQVAHFPELEIPAGLLHGQTPPAAGEARAAMEAFMATQLSGTLQGRALAVGRAPLNVGYVPLAHQDGQFGLAVEVDVTAQLRRPLRAQAATTAMLRPLEQPAKLFAMVVLGPDRARAAAVAGEAMERWLEVIAPAAESSFETVLSSAEAGVRPKTGKLATKQLAASKKWRDLRAALVDCRGFSATLRSPPPRMKIADLLAAPIGRMLAGGHGFSLATALIGGDPADPDLPHLGLWLDLGAPGVQPDAAERTLIALVDHVVGQGAVQAMVGRWDWSPGFVADSTPYELASGVHGQCTTRRGWCQRFLRGVTDTLWLGAPLLARVDRAAVAEIAELTALGEVTRVVLRAPAGLAALEVALAPVIASAADWKTGIDRMYGR